MGTSLAPSPIDKVTGCGEMPVRTSFTIQAFCNGETLHAITTLHCIATSRKLLFRARWSICSSALPVTMSAASTSLAMAASVRSRNSTSSFRKVSNSTPHGASKTAISILSLSTFVLKPMLRAVSNLSPVSTQSLMPALRNRTMVLATSSCNLSSIAVAPTISKFTSILSATSANMASRSVCDVCADSKSACQASTSSAESFRRASTNVLKPSCANSMRCDSISLLNEAARWSMTLSAPFTSTQVSPEGARTTTDIRFLVELKALTAKMWYSLEVAAAPFLPATSTMRRCPARFLKFHPMPRAASTRAPSSGLSASNLVLPHWSVVAMTVCATARISRNALIESAERASSFIARSSSRAPVNPRPSETSPYIALPMDTRFRSMTFWVKVPVLSENM
mmetsp:Transcript_106898/g.309238  ORF Transcript_106898/g.309238 Transcript_106898/m.309238 type:complete len:396 (-) Transcript_106898:1318-2505(-)